jgi:carbon storage regulator CsrA
MLVLGRKLNEAVRITTPGGETVEVTVARIDRGGVRLGFAADPAVRIDRLEVAERRAAAPAVGPRVAGARALAAMRAPAFCRRCDFPAADCRCHGGAKP